jgi:hypothetical protein
VGVRVNWFGVGVWFLSTLIGVDVMKEQIKKMAIQANMNYLQDKCWMAHNTDLERFAELVRQDEREACAKLCDLHANNGASFVCAATIRARGNHEQD